MNKAGADIKILMVSALLHPSYGGPATVFKNHYNALSRLCSVKVCGLYPPGKKDELLALYPEASLSPLSSPARWFYSSGLGKIMEQEIKQTNIIHAHMLWDYPVWLASRLAGKHHKPFILTPHGSIIEDWRRDSLHKKFYWKLMAKKMLNKAATVHVLNEAEAEAFRSLKITSPLSTIPNGLSPEDPDLKPPCQTPAEKWPALKDKKILLYLGRLWKEKGLMELLRSWNSIERHNNWTLVLAGPDYRNYRHEIESFINRNSLKNILLTGEVHGDDKASLLHNSKAFILPSRSEGFSLSITEAMYSGLPVIATKQCNFPEIEKIKAGWIINDLEASLKNCLELVLNLKTNELSASGKKAADYAKDNFLMDNVSDKLLQLYQELL